MLLCIQAVRDDILICKSGSTTKDTCLENVLTISYALNTFANNT